MTPVSSVAESTELADFQKRVANERAREATIVQWHMKAYLESDGVIDLPWTPDTTYINVTVGNYGYVPRPTEDDPEHTEYEYVIDEAATLDKLRAIARFAADYPDAEIEKQYKGDFELKVTIPVVPNGYSSSAGSSDYDRKVILHYSADRETVCTKKVVGTKVIPASFNPERVEEVIEWDCQKVSLLKQP